MIARLRAIDCANSFKSYYSPRVVLEDEWLSECIRAELETDTDTGRRYRERLDGRVVSSFT